MFQMPSHGRERVASAAAVPQGGLLDAASDLVDDLGSELHDVERVGYRDGIFELVVDAVLVAVERVQRGDGGTAAEVRATLLEPVGVGSPGPAGHEVQEAGMDTSCLVTGQVDHPSQLLRPTAARLDRLGGDVVLHVLIDPQGLHAGEPCGVGGHLLEQRLDRRPHRLPGRAELTGDALHRGALTPDLGDAPPPRTGGQQTPWWRETLVGLGKRPDPAQNLGAAAQPLAPDQIHRRSEARDVDQPNLATTARGRDHPAARTAQERRGGLDRHPQPAGVLIAYDIDDAVAVETDEQVAPITRDRPVGGGRGG